MDQLNQLQDKFVDPLKRSATQLQNDPAKAVALVGANVGLQYLRGVLGQGPKPSFQKALKQGAYMAMEEMILLNYLM